MTTNFSKINLFRIQNKEEIPWKSQQLLMKTTRNFLNIMAHLKSRSKTRILKNSF